MTCVLKVKGTTGPILRAIHTCMAESGCGQPKHCSITKLANGVLFQCDSRDMRNQVEKYLKAEGAAEGRVVSVERIR